VPFQLRGTERFFDRAEVRQAVNLLRVAARSAAPDEDPAAAVRPILTGLGLTKDPPAGRGRARERWESLEALAQLAADFFASAPNAALGDLVAELEVRSAIGHEPDTGGVTLASLHAAKGLEWDVVFLPCLTDGAVPIVYAQTAEAIEEERRLLYVGITRARDQLFLSWALARAPGGKRTRKPSRFLDGLRSPVGASWPAGAVGPCALSGPSGAAGASRARRRGQAAEPAALPRADAAKLDRYSAAGRLVRRSRTDGVREARGDEQGPGRRGGTARP
jgi:DNA helicase-2/ATP-dependent DNA helicase PcrA